LPLVEEEGEELVQAARARIEAEVGIPAAHVLIAASHSHSGPGFAEHPEWGAELVGKDRLNAIELNVFVPYRLAKGDSSVLKNLPVEPMNSIIRETAYTLFGPDHSPKLYRSALARQGLIQIFNDFILTGRRYKEDIA
jgi:hypothetical protein